VLTFLGTRGYLDVATDRHRRHTATAIEHRGRRVVLDCGEDWRGRIDEMCARAIVVTHAHPDHAFGLDAGAPCPVWATQDTWDRIGRFPVAPELRRTFAPRTPVEIEGITFECFPVVHSVRCPAAGYRITAGRTSIFYVPDVVWIPDRDAAFAGIAAYVGDGATVERNMVRRHKETGSLVGHATIKTQLGWCRDEGVPRMIVTHCGTDIVGGDEPTVVAKIRRLAHDRGVDVEVAHDGMELTLHGARARAAHSAAAPRARRRVSLPT
jgi:ribonuclease BN (tRNA processing enzyme)